MTKKELNRQLENLRPGDVKAHLALAEQLIAAKMLGRDVSESMIHSVALTDAKLEAYRDGLAKLLSR